GDRSPGAPQRDPGVKRSQLSGRAGQEGGSETVGIRRSKQGGVTGSKHGYRRGREGTQEDRSSSGLYTIPEAGILIVVRRKSNCRQSHHARLASGCWSGSTGRDWLPAGFHLKGFKRLSSLYVCF